MARSVDEWIGATDDSKVPPRVRVRIFEKFGGRCYLSGRVIRPGDRWEIEHVVALSSGGQNRESNLAPVCIEAHKEKTKEDVKTKSKIARVKKKHLGLGKSSNPLPGGRGSKWKKKIGGGIVRR